MIKENKVSKYALYAIGEIVLVVIGILIALNVSNLNEIRKNTIAFEALMNNLDEAMKTNLDEVTMEINQSYDYMTTSKLILEKKVLRNEPKLSSIIDASLLDLNDADIIPLLNKQDDFPEKYKKLIPLLKSHQTLWDRRKLEEQSLIESENNYRNYLISNQNWYGSIDDTLKENELDFYESNPTFKNHIKSHRSVAFYNTREAIGIRSYEIVILAELKRIRNAFNDKEVKQYIIDKGLSQIAEIDCNSKNIPKEENLATDLPVGFIPIYNSLNKKIRFKRVNNDGTIDKKSMVINPKQLSVNIVSLRVSEGMEVEIHIDNQCYKKYQIGKDGFLFIE